MAQGGDGIGEVDLAVVVGVRSVVAEDQRLALEERAQGDQGIGELHLASGVRVAAQEAEARGEGRRGAAGRRLRAGLALVLGQGLPFPAWSSQEGELLRARGLRPR